MCRQRLATLSSRHRCIPALRMASDSNAQRALGDALLSTTVGIPGALLGSVCWVLCIVADCHKRSDTNVHNVWMQVVGPSRQGRRLLILGDSPQPRGPPTARDADIVVAPASYQARHPVPHVYQLASEGTAQLAPTANYYMAPHMLTHPGFTYNGSAVMRRRVAALRWMSVLQLPSLVCSSDVLAVSV